MGAIVGYITILNGGIVSFLLVGDAEEGSESVTLFRDGEFVGVIDGVDDGVLNGMFVGLLDGVVVGAGDVAAVILG